MKIAICDDSEKDRNILMKFIKKLIDSENLDVDPDISLFTSGEELENCYIIGNGHFDIIFLDVFLSGKDGIRTAREIRKHDSKCLIIFTTVSTAHALDSYSVFAYSYLVKPISINKFKTVFLRANEEIYSKKQKNLCIRTGAKLYTIHHSDIKYITSRGKKIFVFDRQNEVIDGFYKLDDIQAMINDTRFIRSHKSYLVNMDYIKSVEKYHFILNDNTIVPIRQKEFSKIRQKYYEYIIRRSG
jgi:DNA-binding LytR/AlgR family response regulator